MDTAELPTPLAKARLLAGDIAAAGDEIERTRRIPKTLLDKLHEARLCRMLLPRSVDGDEIDPGAYLLTIEEISRHDASVGWNLFVTNSAALLAPHMPAETAQTIFGDPRALVAWGPPDKHVAKAVEGGYRVSGRWSFASGCRNATWMGAHCRVQEPDGSLRKHPDGRSLVLSLLFPVAQAKLIDTWDTIGLRGTASDTYELDDLFVPEAFTGTREHPDDSTAARERDDDDHHEDDGRHEPGDRARKDAESADQECRPDCDHEPHEKDEPRTSPESCRPACRDSREQE